MKTGVQGRIISVVGIVFCISVLFAGCASLQKSQQLARQGIEVATTIGASYQLSKEELETYVEGEYLLSGFDPMKYPPPTENMLRNINIVKDELQLRKNMFDELASVYASFEALSAYPAGENMQAALGSLTGSIDNYLKFYKKQNDNDAAIPDSAAKLIKMVGGAVAGIEQKSSVRKASAMISARLKAIKKLLKKQSELVALEGIREEIEDGKMDVLINLWQTGVCSATPILEKFASAYGLALDTQKAVYTAADERIKKPIEEVLKYRHRQQKELINSSYGESLNALDALIEAHHKLEAGEDVSLVTVKAFMEKMSGYVNAIRGLKNEGRK